ncbi:hypothetical protein BJF81_02335 [Ornithinimicrobium sp. CNJ-824]|uniref:E3 binding domain-containing protein n=1 Tax=Ornithinimicrobium sp. CNJ-824 TaxID=1904966 RepID=UPI0009592B18|nr:E3 binding domain-containing protein [Ornithinimicrobium sp. CNJ-824]OLT21400.1 hypothetical protein BJF81_02335 [Ornithinimicrobium sp. CNJ-824]
MTIQHHTPLVNALAARLGVDLATITGSGAGGRVTADDVRAAAPPRQSAPSPQVPPRATSARASGEKVTYRASNGETVTVSTTALNPLLDEIKQSKPELARHMLAAQPAPTLFATGDLPVFTASGIDPSRLRELPWHVRHAAARADSRAALALFERFTPADEMRSAEAEMEHGHDSSNADYRDRMRHWEMTAGISNELYP